MAKFRILALDGGGIRGLLTLVLLQRLEAAVPGWLDQVDLIAGTSTGGIITLGLAYGMSPAELRRQYQEHCKEVFNDTFLDDVMDLGNLVGAEYASRNLANLLHDIVGDARLKDLAKKVLVSAFDLDNENPEPKRRSWKAKFFHNFEGEDSDGEMLAYKVGLYTSLAPTYFPAVDGFIDGGVVANNPAMAALCQTQDQRIYPYNPPALDEIVLLSLSTGRLPRFIEGDDLDWGLVQWAPKLVDIILDGGNEVVSYQCRQILDQRFHRVTPLLGSPIEMDECSAMGRLVRIGEQTDLSAAEEWLREYWLE